MKFDDLVGKRVCIKTHDHKTATEVTYEGVFGGVVGNFVHLEKSECSHDLDARDQMAGDLLLQLAPGDTVVFLKEQ